MRAPRRSKLVPIVVLAALVGSLLAIAPGARAGDEARVGFGARAITPVGEPPAEWAPYFWQHPTTKVWSEPFEDLDGDGCLDGVNNGNVEGIADDPSKLPGETPEPHVDQPWNSTGDAYMSGAYDVRGVTIVGDPLSAGKWDGLWANAGFGSRCTLGMKDDTWARAVVLESGGKTVALVSLDVVGLFNLEVQRARRELKARYPELPIDEIVISSTHTHEGVDTMGFWGQLFAGVDGKFPAYQAFIRSQILDAIHDAYTSREEARVRFAKVEHTIGIRDSRPPHVIDPWALAAEFIGRDGETIGTIVNWSNHPEAQGSDNPYVSSDFVHQVRETLEQDGYGTAVYFSGSVGGLMTPLGVDIPGFGKAVSWERTYEIGRLLAVAVEAGLEARSRAWEDLVAVDELEVETRAFEVTSDNALLRALNTNGIFDIPTYTGGESWGDDPAARREGVYSAQAGSEFRTEMTRVRFGPAVFLTVPGELFPEIELGGYGRPDCAEANTGRPYEPVIAEQYEEEYQFVLGLGQDELGYIVPGYDFWVFSAPEQRADGRGVVSPGGEQVRKCGEGHYEETVSGGSTLAPWVACVAAELAGKDPWDDEAACSYENTHRPPYGIDPGL